MGDSTPICRCRVLYLGSSVPRQSKDGLQGIQEPLKSLYPSDGAIGAKGIDSWLSVWSNGILLENVDENLKQITRFFPIESLHYCAAVRQVLIPENDSSDPEPKFLPLDSPFARMPRAQHPPIFAAILRRTTGIKVLECHVFICKREAAANALVRCCFHAYADNSYARQLETGGSVYGTLKSSKQQIHNDTLTRPLRSPLGINSWPSGSTMSLSSASKRVHEQPTCDAGAHNFGENMNTNLASGYSSLKNAYDSSIEFNGIVDDIDASSFNNENHKIWHSSQEKLVTENPYEAFSVFDSTLGRSVRSRQISHPIEVPPPPTKQRAAHSKKKSKMSSKSSGSQSLSGTLVRSRPMVLVPRPPSAAPSNIAYSAATRHYHTISRGYPYAGAPPMHHSNCIPSHTQISTQPPISNAGQNPIMMHKQFATLQSTRSLKKRKNKNMAIPIGMPVIPPAPMYTYSNGQMFYQQQGALINPVPIEFSNRKLAASVGNGLDCGTLENESPEGTGIYRRGHINERAFSYSIRQEHRSRSHGSLASLQFFPTDTNKERELAQLVAGLNLNESSDRNLNALLDRKNVTMKDDTFSNGNALSVNGVEMSRWNRKKLQKIK